MRCFFLIRLFDISDVLLMGDKQQQEIQTHFQLIYCCHDKKKFMKYSLFNCFVEHFCSSSRSLIYKLSKRYE